MNLENILKEMEVARPNAEMDLQMGNANTYGNRLGLKKAATETLKRLKVDYRKQLLTSTLFIVVTGPGRDAFSELAAGPSFGCFSVDPESFFKQIASKVTPSLFGRESTRALFGIAGNLFEDRALDLDIVSYPMLMFNDKYNRSVKDADDFAVLLRNAVNDQVGAEIVGINAVDSIVDSAIQRRHSDVVTPVILNTSEEGFALDLAKNLRSHRLPDGTLRGLTSKVFLVVAGKPSKTFQGRDAVFVKNVTEESVGEALASIRNKL